MPNSTPASCVVRRRLILTGSSALRAITIGAAAAALTGATALGGLGAWTLLGTRSRRRTVETVPPIGVGLVLGAEAYEDRTPTPSLRGRLDLALRLYRAGKVRALIVSGDEAANHQVSVMAQYLVDHGVPEADVILDPLGVDTYASCARAQEEYGLDQVTMISQDYHLPRALTICRMIGLDAYGVGDPSVRLAAPKAWRRSVRREVGANVKMLGDLLRHRFGGRPGQLG